MNSIWFVFIVLWMFIVFSEFLKYDPNYIKSLEAFQYYDLLFILVSLGAGVSFYLNKWKKKGVNWLNGISLFSFLLFLDAIIVFLFYSKLDELKVSASGYFSHLSHVLIVSCCLFLIYIVVRLFGLIFTNIFPPKTASVDLPMIQIAIGVMLFTLFLFFLGTLNLLHSYFILFICILALGLYWRHAIQIVRTALFDRITIPSGLSLVGVFSFLFLSIFVILNYVNVLRPIPFGADSLNLYVNIPSLISQYNGLIDGNQPYYWSLFMSTGLLVFERIDVVLSLSFVGGILALFTLYRLSRKWLDVNYSALVCLIFYSLPMINFLSYLDMKVDMGLLYISLTILLLYYNWIAGGGNEKPIQSKQGFLIQRVKTFFRKKSPDFIKKNRLLVFIGLLSGFAFGIKLTILFFFLAIHCTIWFVKGDKLTFLSSFFLCFASIFIAKLDAQAGLRVLHDNVEFLQYILLLIGMVLIGVSYAKNKDRVMSLMKYSMVIGGFFLLPILPWIGKNLHETGEISITALLNGKKASPVISFESAIDEEFIKEDIDKDLQRDKNLDRNRDRSKDNDIDREKRREERIKRKERREKEKRIAEEKEEAESVKEEESIVSSSVREDLHRFMGYEFIPIRYLTLAYDVFIKTNMPHYFTDISFLLLLLIPLLFLFPSSSFSAKKSIFVKLGFVILCGLLMFLSIPSSLLSYYNLATPSDGLALLESRETVGLISEFSNTIYGAFLSLYNPVFDWLKTISSSKDPYTYSILMGLFLAILYLIHERIKHHSSLTQSFVYFLSIYFFLWWILGSGVAWYGILIFCIPFIFLFYSIDDNRIEKQINRDENKIVSSSIFQGNIKKYLILISCSIWILFSFTKRTANYSPNNKEAVKHILYPSTLSYQTSQFSEEQLIDFHFPNMRMLAEIMNKDKNALIFRIGSPINYFIDKNDSRVLNDTFLDVMMSLVNHYNSKEKIISHLKKDGYKYIVFDLNMATYDNTPTKSLTNKFNQFMNVLHNNSTVELLATDRIIKINNESKNSIGVFPEAGTIVVNGTIAVYRIK